VRPRRGCATVTTQGEVEEIEDGDAGEAVQLLACATIGALSHRLDRLSEWQSMEVPEHAHVATPWAPWCHDRQTIRASWSHLQGFS